MKNFIILIHIWIKKLKFYFSGKKPAHWASINNGIYLCIDCSGEHRGLGVSTSYIRSTTLDTW
jgi:hypothetical protein